MTKIMSKINPLTMKDEKLFLLDQRILPYEKKYIECSSYTEVIYAIKDMVVRGAPLIGITAAYGMVLAAYEIKDKFSNPKDLINKLNVIGEEIKNSRPTAINLIWAIDLILKELSKNNFENVNEITNCIFKTASWIHEDDILRCKKIGEHGEKLIKHNDSILTICNTGALATGGIGTAFGVILTAHNNNKKIKLYASETRPRQQGARLTTFEAYENGIDCTLISDTACGHLMQNEEINFVIAGADRICANGDTANKIGTYQLAVLAKENNLPFYIAAPHSTFDLSLNSGSEIPIEERNEKEVLEINEKRICQENIKARNPAFDVTPSKYITGFITESGVLTPPFNFI